LKKKISLLLAFIFIVSFIIPLNGYAADMNQELENAIRIAKTKFEIPQDYKFNSSIGTSGTKKIYYLDWNSKDDANPASIYVAVDEKGVIISYSSYSMNDYKINSKLPKLSRHDAKAMAEKYIENIAPGLMKNLAYEEPGEISILDTSYYFTYYRVVNGVPFYNDRVNVTVSRDTGALREYNRRWTEDAVFPGAKNVISLDEAQKAYAEKLGIRLTYKTYVTEEGIKAYLVYSPKYSNNYYGIDAITGEKQRLGRDYILYGAMENGQAIAKEAMADRAGRAVELTPDELAAVQEAGLLKSLEEVEEIARSSKFLNISPEHARQSYQLSTNWPERNEYVWSLQFAKPKEPGQSEDYISVSVNAKTGVIVSFYRGSAYADGALPKDKFETVKKNVDAFLSVYYPEYYRQVEYDEGSDEDYAGTSNESYYLNYRRIVNGAVCPDNGINVNYDNVNGMITSFNLSWYNITFPTASKAMSIDEANGKLFEKVGLGLEYRYKYIDASGINPLNESEVKPELVLVYTLKPGKPFDIDANTGELLNYGGTPYKEPVKIEYTDIDGHYAKEEIMVLAEYGIYLEGTEFRPEAKITQKEFLSLLSKTLSYYRPILTSASTSEEIDDLYAFLQREGVIKTGEKNPDAAVTREEAVKFAIRALKYDKVADIKGIFNCSFKDKGQIDENLIGYVTIASGLGIVSGSGGNFRPRDHLTRAESIVMIYNYLRI